MEQQYKLTEAEFVHQGTYIAGRLATNRRRRGFMIILSALMTAVVAAVLMNSVPAAVIGAAIGAIYGVYAHRVSTRTQLSQLYRVIHRDEPVTVDLTEGGLYVALRHIRSQVDWEALTAIEEDSVGFYFIYGPLNAVFVPRRVFASAGDAQRFWAQAQESWQFARPATKTASV